MKFVSAIVLTVASIAYAQNNCPNGLAIRYEWRDLPENEKQRFLNAIRTLHLSGDGYNNLARIHYDNRGGWHSTPYFLPVHRQHLKLFEDAIRGVDANVTIPYWAWSLDANQPSSSDIWNYFSRSDPNNPDPNQCVTDNVLGGKPVSVITPHCLVRGVTTNGPEPGSFADQPTLGSLISNNADFTSFSEALEFGPHANVHFAIGGANGDFAFMRSPNDPLFWLHHGYVDKLWFDWQNFSPDRQTQFMGASASDIMPGFRNSVASVLRSSDMCVTYRAPGSQFTGPFETPQPVQPPQPPTQPDPEPEASPSVTPPQDPPQEPVVSNAPPNPPSQPQPAPGDDETDQLTPVDGDLNVVQNRPVEEASIEEPVEVILGPQPAGVPQQYKQMANLTEEQARRADQIISSAYCDSRQKIASQKAAILPGHEEPVPVAPTGYTDNLDSAAVEMSASLIVLLSSVVLSLLF